ncbi:sigma-54-dependent transcriptional regulator [Acidaminobacter sp. JC074]|uniref:sigma-54 interaction domain-containing protein n=1 Tax=Acidaminobacter sp. JC074 TaxID=2530199 RepID=UPI001F0E7B20|nr:sigma-54-dependent Fis family transcriptional regulator [Acidaminobacter sp. JC074]MCH4889988.1 sigma-54-dependent transcriptional regulator [Acidaminobacter sp. JC074]
MKRELELILDSTHDAMIAVDIDGVITLYNRAAEKLTHFSADHVIGKNITEVIENTRLPHIMISGQAELDQKQQLGNTEIITNRMPVKDKNGHIIGAIAVFRDISEVAGLAEKITNLKQVRSMLEAIINATQDAISVVDENGYGILINPAYSRLTGYYDEDIIGKLSTVDLGDDGESIHLEVLRKQAPVTGLKFNVGLNRRDVYVSAAPIFENGELKGSVAVLQDFTETRRLSKELDQAKQIIRNLEAKYTFEDIKGENPVIINAIEKAKLAADTPATVLLQGESGTGKELFAHAIHNASDRKHSKFVRVNCMAINEGVLESELFGYSGGAFTGALKSGKAGYFEMADGGTIFLDEIGEISLATQAKLLRVLQEKEVVRVGDSKVIPVDVRVIAATNVDLEKAIEIKRFRKDLYYRLNVIPIKTPALREHKDDIKPLIISIIQKQNQVFGRSVRDLSDEALHVIEANDWPGNIRELENYIARAMINMRFNEIIITRSHLPIIDHQEVIQLPDKKIAKNFKASSLQDKMDLYEKQYIEKVLKLNQGNKVKTAETLEISIRNLYYKLNKHQIKE